ncbi:putative fimbrial chaperone protein StfD [Serratia fonticola]|uniref:Putative fimbrial chaperone protein StfD n=1 Tax=Serratia fonticola TaxID=47917 RepID=A0A4U9TKU7_SERFO|nr:putative fimbrial chaperone protein StfD [Serratia fonticola]
MTLSKQGDKYVVNNPTPYYVTLVDASNKKDGPGIKNFEPMMVPPKGNLPLTVECGGGGQQPGADLRQRLRRPTATEFQLQR